jgi:hypothetical protein
MRAVKRWAVVGLLVLAACGSGNGSGNPSVGESSVPKGSVLKGTVTAPECAGGYAITNANVEVRNQSNTLIGTGTTGSDVATHTGTCTAEFTVELAEEATFYKVTIGTHDGPSCSKADLDAANWTIDLELK